LFPRTEQGRQFAQNEGDLAFGRVSVLDIGYTSLGENNLFDYFSAAEAGREVTNHRSFCFTVKLAFNEGR
jgi:hypothetical protein